MNQIPYIFGAPVPKYFRENGWFENENTFKFVHWAFARCQCIAHVEVMDSQEILLQPFEFIAGRLTSHHECFLTEKRFRGQLISMQKAGLLKKTANSRANRFTCYIWVTDRFSENEGQQKGRPRANRGPTEGHKEDMIDHDHDGSKEGGLDMKKQAIAEELIVMRYHLAPGVCSIKKIDLIQGLEEEGFTLTEIEKGIKVIQQNDPVLKTKNIKNYLKTTLTNIKNHQEKTWKKTTGSKNSNRSYTPHNGAVMDKGTLAPALQAFISQNGLN